MNKQQFGFTWAVSWSEGMPYLRSVLSAPAMSNAFSGLRTFSKRYDTMNEVMTDFHKAKNCLKVWRQAIINGQEMPIGFMMPEFGTLAIDAALAYFQSQRGLGVSNEAVLEQLHDQGFVFATMAHVEEARQDFEDEEEADAHWEESKAELFKDLF